MWSIFVGLQIERNFLILQIELSSQLTTILNCACSLISRSDGCHAPFVDDPANICSGGSEVDNLEGSYMLKVLLIFLPREYEASRDPLAAGQVSIITIITANTGSGK